MSFEVRLRKNETVDTLIKRFLKKVKKEHLFEELFERSYYKKPSVKKREAHLKRVSILKKLREKEKRFEDD